MRIRLIHIERTQSIKNANRNDDAAITIGTKRLPAKKPKYDGNVML